MTPADTLQRLADLADILDVIHTYCDLTDRSTYEDGATLDALVDVFTPDATVDYGFGSIYPTAQAWIDQWKEMWRRLGRVHHVYGNFLIAVDGDRALATYHALARHNWDNGDIWQAGAVFETGFVRTSAGWRIASIDLHVRYVDDPNERMQRMAPQLTQSFVEHERPKT